MRSESPQTRRQGGLPAATALPAASAGEQNALALPAVVRAQRGQVDRSDAVETQRRPAAPDAAVGAARTSRRAPVASALAARSQVPPVRFVYLTTLREIAGDEQVGSTVRDPESGADYGRRVGNLEDLVRKLSAPTGSFGQRFELAGVVFDDDPALVADYRARGVPWPWDLPVPARAPDGSPGTTTLDALCFGVPSSDWRAEKDPVAKATAKALYEQRIVDFLNRSRADLVITDSYTRIVGPTLLSWIGTLDQPQGYGRGLNIHPAVARVQSPTRLPGVTPTRDAYTRAKFGYIIVDDKKAVDLPRGERVTVTYEGQPRQAIQVPAVRETGVTVHVLAPRVDNGRVVLEKKAVLPEEGLTLERIRDLNYGLKREALSEALAFYGRRAEVRRLITAGRAVRAQS